MTGLADRLRSLRRRNGWTVAEMSEPTGIPKKTLEKYMLRERASLPGLEALVALSKGLGVPLDWLVFGDEQVSRHTELLAGRAAHDAVLRIFEGIIRHHLEGDGTIQGERLCGNKPEEWAILAQDMVTREIGDLIARGVNLDELRRWMTALRARSAELLHDRVDALLERHPELRAKGTGN